MDNGGNESVTAHESYPVVYVDVVWNNDVVMSQVVFEWMYEMFEYLCLSY